MALENISEVRVAQSARLKLNGQVVPVHTVTYMIGDQGPFTDEFDDLEFTPANVQAKQAEKIINLHVIGVPLPRPPEPIPGDPDRFRVHLKPTPGGGPGGPAPVLPEPIVYHLKPKAGS